MKSPRRLPTVWQLLSLLLLVLGSFPSARLQSQNRNPDSTLKLTDTIDGFVGAFSFDGKQYPIHNSVTKDGFATLVNRPEGTPLVMTAKKDHLIQIGLPAGLIKLDTENPRFTDEEINTIRTFIASDDAALIRRIVYEVRNRRVIEKDPRLNGFRVIAMLLGDGDVRIAAGEKNVDGGKLKFKPVSYKCPTPANPATPNPPACDASNCCGCCGAGCWGCTGCYTVECLYHDVCVETLGYAHPRCMAYLALAIASMSDC